MKRLFLSLTILGTVIVAWAEYQSVSQSAEVSLARFMPQGPLLFLEGKDFAGLLQAWSSSPEKQAWLGSDNYQVFSRSRLFLRLHDAQGEFAAAAGVPPNTHFVSEVAGKRTALAIYDIGKLEMLYITELPSTRAMESGIWQQRSKFEPREIAGQQFFVRSDSQSGRDVAFAISGDYLILATREDLVAGALAAIGKGRLATLDHEAWFVDAVKAAKQPGDLRTVIRLEEVAKTPHFRSYWIQQNITAMRQYRSSVSDLYRSASQYREDRVLLERNPEAGSANQDAVGALGRVIPPETGFYAVQASPSPDDVIASLEQKVLMPKTGPVPASQVAPSVNLEEGTVGSASNLEEHIDVPPATPRVEANGDESLKLLIRNNPPQAMLKLHRSEIAADEVFVRLRSTLVLSAGNSWNEDAVRFALQKVVSPAVTSSSIGTAWKTVGGGQEAYSEFGGLIPVAVAVRGSYLFVSNDPEGLAAALRRLQQKGSAPEPALYIAGFNHQKERQQFYKLAALVDQANRNNNAAQERNPEFFSDNIGSLSKTLGQNLATETIEIRRTGGVESQTVRYEWAHSPR